MCHNIRTISIVKSGELSICENCNVYHLEFNNIYFEFTIQQFKQFKDYLDAIEIGFWERKYTCSKMKRKIPIPSIQNNLVLMFNRQEIKELQCLFSLDANSSTKLLLLSEIDYTLIVN
ncbi:hypothetical protein A9Q86_03365 [Flavobacteriales bacterium 33_180_T64]|nr:hypothetical protein A9Q86_03365 [Flavobacteriales bacterium 33_180_T64]